MNEEKIEAVIDLASFLVWAADEKEIFGGVNAEDALKSFSLIVGLPVEGLRKIAKPWVDN